MKKTYLFVAIAAVVVIAGIATLVASQTTSENPRTLSDDPSLVPSEGESVKQEAVRVAETDAAGDTSAPEEVIGTLTQVGSYETYAPEKIARADEGAVVLFFKASWCPSCRVLDENLRTNKDAIPAGVTILEVDYDTHTNLRREYGVTTQHTLVQVQNDGTMLKKWSGGSTLESVLDEII